jgi:hypothetical protein
MKAKVHRAKGIKPDEDALKRIEREYPSESDADKYLLAQADTLIRSVEKKKTQASWERMHKQVAKGSKK